jgi:hypothetical protein
MEGDGRPEPDFEEVRTMIELVMLFATAAAEPAAPAQADAPPIDVRGRRTICRYVNDSAQSRLNRQRVCRTQLEWDEVRDQAAEFLEDMPRRNPAKSRDLVRNGE